MPTPSKQAAGGTIGTGGGDGRSSGPIGLRVFEADGPLIGRAADLARIDRFLVTVARTPDGGGPLLLLGEPGVGKTALLAAAVARAERRGMHVVAAAGQEYRAHLSHSGLGRLIAETAAARPPVDPGEALAVALGHRDGSPPDHEAVARDVLSLFARLAGHRPTLIVVDDVQWLDPASATILGDVARRMAGFASGMLCAAREGSDSFFDHSGLPIHDVRPLGESDAQDLLERSFPALAPRVRRRLITEARGNPLALLELPIALDASPPRTAAALPERLPLSRKLQSAFASRITGLPPTTRYLLLLAALDATGDLDVVRRAATGRCGLKHLAPAERAQLIRVHEPAGLRFRHPLTRSAVVELATSDQRRSGHRALARAWQEVPERQAWHLAQAAQGPDEGVAALLERAAGVIGGRGDGPAAVAALLRAADLTPSAPERARRLAEAACTSANISGDLRDVPHLLDTARRTAPGADSPAMAVAGAAYLLNGSGDIDTAHRLLCGALTTRPAPYDPADTALADALHALLLVCFFGGRPELWPQFDAALARYPLPPVLLAAARRTFADPARTGPADLAVLDEAIAGLTHDPDPRRIVRTAIAGAYLDRLDGCIEALHRVVAGGRRGEHIAPAIDALFLLGNHAWLTGQWQHLQATAREGLDLCEQHHYPMQAWVGRYLLACTAAARGDHESTRTLTDRMSHWAGPRRADTVRAYAAHARTLSALGQGNFEEAYQQATLITPPGTLPSHAPHAMWTFMDLVEAAMRTGRRTEARDHAAAARTAGLDALSPRLRMLVHAAGALTADDDRHTGFQDALSVEGAERWPFDLARIHLHYGERLRRARARSRARHHLGTAADLFGQLGAAPWADRANQELRACGTPARTAPRSATAVLTPQQREIATLAAAGLTNKRIAERLSLSPRTVSTHLYQLFPKVGVTSRAGLRDALEHLDEQ
ncbi:MULTISPECIES: LuxR family transcriptional regulator [Streptomyces]|uniref:helix-turn-helix transcriptional regulator n=1 Tax=Streptomyces TaxID=1883 RepID=UPI00099C7AF7|nr:LuxR family transcriptional regulator [Streptomyces virginiae]